MSVIFSFNKQADIVIEKNKKCIQNKEVESMSSNINDLINYKLVSELHKTILEYQ